MTDEIRAVYTVGAGGLIVNFLLLGLNVFMARRANNLKSVARHEQNFAVLKEPLAEALGKDLITLEDKR